MVAAKVFVGIALTLCGIAVLAGFAYKVSSYPSSDPSSAFKSADVQFIGYSDNGQSWLSLWATYSGSVWKTTITVLYPNQQDISADGAEAPVYVTDASFAWVQNVFYFTDEVNGDGYSVYQVQNTYTSTNTVSYTSTPLKLKHCADAYTFGTTADAGITNFAIIYSADSCLVQSSPLWLFTANLGTGSGNGYDLSSIQVNGYTMQSASTSNVVLSDGTNIPSQSVRASVNVQTIPTLASTKPTVSTTTAVVASYDAETSHSSHQAETQWVGVGCTIPSGCNNCLNELTFDETYCSSWPAILSFLSYHGYQEGKVNGGWKAEYCAGKSTSIKSCTYYKSWQSGSKPVTRCLSDTYGAIYSFVGTTNAKDMGQDIDNVPLVQFGMIVKQGVHDQFYEQHLHSARMAFNDVPTATNILLIGHSLGGAIAHYVSRWLQVRTTNICRSDSPATVCSTSNFGTYGKQWADQFGTAITGRMYGFPTTGTDPLTGLKYGTDFFSLYAKKSIRVVTFSAVRAFKDHTSAYTNGNYVNICTYESVAFYNMWGKYTHTTASIDQACTIDGSSTKTGFLYPKYTRQIGLTILFSARVIYRRGAMREMVGFKPYAPATYERNTFDTLLSIHLKHPTAIANSLGSAFSSGNVRTPDNVESTRFLDPFFTPTSQQISGWNLSGNV